MSPRLLALALGNFMIGTGTLIVPGMLPAIAAAFGTTLPHAAHLISAFAFTVCIGAPILAASTSRFDRRALLVAMQLVFVVGHAAAALLSSFAGLFVARVVSSIGAALYTAQAAATAGLIVAPGERGRAVAFVFLGWSVASVVGLPLGALVGASLGYRAGFALVAAGSLLAAGALWRALPGGLLVAPIQRDSWRGLFGQRAMLLVIAVTAVQGTAQFALFSYFVPAARAMLGASPALVSVLLAAFGVSGLAGNVLAGRVIDRYGAAAVTLAAMLVMLLGHLLWPLSSGSLWLFGAATLIWGSGCFAINSSQQARLLALEPALASVSIALNSSAIYLGQAAGTAAGGSLLGRAPGASGYAALAWLSVPLFLAALGLSFLASRSAHELSPRVGARRGSVGTESNMPISRI